MAIIDKVSLNLSTKLGEKLNKSNEEIDVLNYGLFIFIHTLLGIITNRNVYRNYSNIYN